MKNFILPLLVLFSCSQSQNSALSPDAIKDSGTANPSSPSTTLIGTDPFKGKLQSSLYPKDWKAGFKNEAGQFLQDYSYAGYKNSEEPINYKNSKIFNVIRYGADSQGINDSYGAINRAIKDAEANGGGIVYLPQGKYKSSRRLDIKKRGVVIKGEGSNATKLFFDVSTGTASRGSIEFTPEDYSMSFVSKLRSDVRTFDKELITAQDVSLEKGDDILIGIKITQDFKVDHSMNIHWNSSFNQWRPFFRRDVDSREDRSVKVKVPMRYDLKVRDDLAIYKEDNLMSDCGVEDLAISNTGVEGQSRYHMIKINHAKDCFIRNVRSYAGKAGAQEHMQSGGILVISSKRVTVDNVRLAFPQNVQEGGNGYLFEVSQSNEILVKNSRGEAGRHNFIQNWDFGTSGCVFQRIHSINGEGTNSNIRLKTKSEFHHSLAIANLVDQSILDDGWSVWNRGLESSGAGHSGTENVFWNNSGIGKIISYQYGNGYVIGTQGELRVFTDASEVFAHRQLGRGKHTEPLDMEEHIGKGQDLYPQSLFDHQLEQRL